jgi:anti-sigma regulatory factor (Ser/Thr protein kinase)
MNRVEFTVKASLENERALLDFVDGEFERHGLPTQGEVLVAIEEIFVNIVHYAYLPKEGDITLSLTFDSEAGNVVVRLEDEGKPFNPLEKEAPDLSADIMERKIGGLGIHFVKNLMDKVEYEYVNNKNVLTITKGVSKL